MAGLSSPVDNTESVSFGWMQTILVGLNVPNKQSLRSSSVLFQNIDNTLWQF